MELKMGRSLLNDPSPVTSPWRASWVAPEPLQSPDGLIDVDLIGISPLLNQIQPSPGNGLRLSPLMAPNFDANFSSFNKNFDEQQYLNEADHFMTSNSPLSLDLSL